LKKILNFSIFSFTNIEKRCKINKKEARMNEFLPFFWLTAAMIFIFVKILMSQLIILFASLSATINWVKTLAKEEKLW
jgi:hypothetical protein